MVLNQCGEIIQRCWDDLPNHYPNCRLDAFVIMPNHVHGIVWIDNSVLRSDADAGVGTGFKPVPTDSEPVSINNINIKPIPATKIHGLSEMIRAFKTFSSRRINELLTAKLEINLVFRWQRSFHDRIVRDEAELNRIRDYIRQNPNNWKKDKDFSK